MSAILGTLKKIKHRLAKPKRTIGFDKFLEKPAVKRALVSYLVDPVVQELKGLETSQFSNNGLGRTLPKVLNQLGYIVDVINWDDKSFKPSTRYDLVIQHGARNYNQLRKYLETPLLIHYTTGSYWKYHNEQELKRFEYFKQRHGTALKPDRLITATEEELYRDAQAIICIGDKDTKATYTNAGINNVYNIESASMPEEIRKRQPKKNHFLFISGTGNIHKGLDLLLDVFEATPDLHLHIMSTLDKDFERYYSKALYQLPNIHTYGHVAMRSKEYYDILDQCMFSLLPSCSEGSPGSVIESMHQGLIPIVTRESHIDISSCGFYFKSDRVDGIEAIIKQVVQLPRSQFKKLSIKSRARIEKDYTVQAFEGQLSQILQQILRLNRSA